MRTKNRKLFLSSWIVIALTAVCRIGWAEVVPFATDGSLKMLYDNRMYPQAVEYEGSVYIVWRGEKGLPFIIKYDLESREFSEPVMLLAGKEDEIDGPKYAQDHHFAPVVWTDNVGHLHVLFGCHGGTGGVHRVSKKPGDIAEWEDGSEIAESISYPRVHRIAGDKTLIYFRHRGHLGYWTYRITSDNGKTWEGPEDPPIDFNQEPHDGYLSSHSGSYHTTHASEDGKTLHVAFIWKVEEPVFNKRYGVQLHDHTQRYNLYYAKIDLASGKVFNYEGALMETPLRKLNAQLACLVWDTDERVSAVGPAICLDENEEPYFLLPVSGEDPHKCKFYFVRRKGDEWARTPIAIAGHPFNACHLDRDDAGIFKAYLIANDGAALPGEGMDFYGWGDRVEEWTSDDEGATWRLTRDLSPEKGLRYNNIKFVSRDLRDAATDMFLFYSWPDAHGKGTAYLWDNRK